jgi:ADP-ribose pyrophosphatase YjhB (NUDIX family)
MARTEYYNDLAAPTPNSIVVAVTVFVVDDLDRVLLIRRTDNGLWAIPGGAQDFGEYIAHTAVRETKEETGVDIEVTGLVGIYSNPTMSSSTTMARYASSSPSASEAATSAASPSRAASHPRCDGSRAMTSMLSRSTHPYGYASTTATNKAPSPTSAERRSSSTVAQRVARQSRLQARHRSRTELPDDLGRTERGSPSGAVPQ